MPHLLDATMFWTAAGGGVRRYVEAKNSFAQQRHWTHAVAAPVSDGISRVAVPAWPLPGSGGYRLPVRRAAMARLMERQRPDVIEAGDPYRLAWSALDAAQSLGIPAVAFCHSNLVRLAEGLLPAGAGALAARAARAYLRNLYGRFDAVLAPSESMCAHLRDWGVPRVACQPLGVDSAVFHPRRRDHSWRTWLGMQPDARVLVYAGRFAPEKNLQVLADAVGRLGAPYWLVVVGAGPTPPTGDRVRVLPPRQSPADVAAVLASADAFVHAGDQETFGLSVLEALACGIPVVARACEGLRELVDDNLGMRVERGTSEEFAEAIAALFRVGPESFAGAARARGERGDWQRVLPLLWARYDDLRARARKPEAWAGVDAVNVLR